MENGKLTEDQHTCINAVAELVFRLIATEKNHDSGLEVLDAVASMVEANLESCQKQRAEPPWEGHGGFPYRLA